MAANQVTFLVGPEKQALRGNNENIAANQVTFLVGPEKKALLGNKENMAANQVTFLVGPEKKALLGNKENMAAISPVFAAMFKGLWKNEKVIEIPDLSSESFSVLLRYSEENQTAAETTTTTNTTCNNTKHPDPSSLALNNPADDFSTISSLCLKDGTAWGVLKAADKYCVIPIAKKCFSFLLNNHRSREEPEHLCAVLESTHLLGYDEEHQHCLDKILTNGSKIFRPPFSALCQLCEDCLLAVVRSDHLRNVQEVAVYRAVLAWAAARCRHRNTTSLDTSEDSEPVTATVTPMLPPEEVLQSSSSLSNWSDRFWPLSSVGNLRWLLTKTHCRHQSVTSPPEVTQEELREAAGDVALQVRYLIMPRHVLESFLNDSTTSLLSEEEKDNLLYRDASLFPPTVRQERSCNKTSNKLRSSKTFKHRDRRPCGIELGDGFVTMEEVMAMVEMEGVPEGRVGPAAGCTLNRKVCYGVLVVLLLIFTLLLHYLLVRYVISPYLRKLPAPWDNSTRINSGDE